MKRALTLLAMSATCAAAQADETWPEAFRTAVIAPEDAPKPVIAYEQILVSAEGETLYHFAYDGSAPEGEQLKLLSLAEDMEDQREQILAEISEDPGDVWCDDMADSVKGDVVQREDENGFTVFAYQPTDPDSDGTERKVLERTDARLYIDKATGKPAQISYRLEKPFTAVPFVAKVHSLSVDAECKATPIGRPYNARVEVNMDITVLGKKQLDHTIQTIDNLRFPGLEELTSAATGHMGVED